MLGNGAMGTPAVIDLYCIVHKLLFYKSNDTIRTIHFDSAPDLSLLHRSRHLPLNSKRYSPHTIPILTRVSIRFSGRTVRIL